MQPIYDDDDDDEVVQYAHENAAEVLLQRMRNRLQALVHPPAVSLTTTTITQPTLPPARRRSPQRIQNNRSILTGNDDDDDDFSQFFKPENKQQLKRQTTGLPSQNSASIWDIEPTPRALAEMEAAAKGMKPTSRSCAAAKRSRCTSNEKVTHVPAQYANVLLGPSNADDDIQEFSDDEGNDNNTMRTQGQPEDYAISHNDSFVATPKKKEQKELDAHRREVRREQEELLDRLTRAPATQQQQTIDSRRKGKRGQMLLEEQEQQMLGKRMRKKASMAWIESLLDMTTASIPHTTNNNTAGFHHKGHQIGKYTVMLNRVLQSLHFAPDHQPAPTSSLCVVVQRCIKNVMRCTVRSQHMSPLTAASGGGGAIVDIVVPASILAARGGALSCGTQVAVPLPYFAVKGGAVGSSAILVASTVESLSVAPTRTVFATQQGQGVGSSNNNNSSGNAPAASVLVPRDDESYATVDDATDEWTTRLEELVEIEKHVQV